MLILEAGVGADVLTASLTAVISVLCITVICACDSKAESWVCFSTDGTLLLYLQHLSLPFLSVYGRNVWKVMQLGSQAFDIAFK